MPTKFIDEKPETAEEEKITGGKTGGLKKNKVVEVSEYSVTNDTAFMFHSSVTGTKTKFPWSQLRHIITPKACDAVARDPLTEHSYTTIEGTFTVSLITD